MIPDLADLTVRLHGLPAMSAIAVELIQSLAATDVDIDMLARHIAHDQAITARVLRVANSPFYGLQSQIASIHDAIVVLGFTAVRTLVLTTAMVGTLPAGHCPGFGQDRFWCHVIGTAAAAQALAGPLRQPPDTLFLAGLLHDIGRLALVVLYPDEYATVLTTARAADMRLVEVESEVFGFDHAAAGAALAQHWNFPASIVDAIARHHDPARGGALAAIIHYADGIAQALDLEDAENSQMPLLQQQAVDALGLDLDTLGKVLATTQATFDSFRLVLG